MIAYNHWWFMSLEKLKLVCAAWGKLFHFKSLQLDQASKYYTDLLLGKERPELSCTQAHNITMLHACKVYAHEHQQIAVIHNCKSHFKTTKSRHDQRHFNTFNYIPIIKSKYQQYCRIRFTPWSTTLHSINSNCKLMQSISYNHNNPLALMITICC